MSSTYRVLCLSHDPAIELSPEWNNPAEAVAAARNPLGHEELAAHVNCDLLVGRYSYPLIEVGCPSSDHHHNDAQWIDTTWLRLLARAYSSHDVNVLSAAQHAPVCWGAQRVKRLQL